MAASKELTAARYYGKVCNLHTDYKGLRGRASRGCVACATEAVALRASTPEAKQKSKEYDLLRMANPTVRARKVEIDAIRRSTPENKLRLAKERQEPERKKHAADLAAARYLLYKEKPAYTKQKAEYNAIRNAAPGAKELKAVQDALRSADSETKKRMIAVASLRRATPEFKIAQAKYSAIRNAVPEQKLHNAAVAAAYRATPEGQLQTVKNWIRRNLCKEAASIYFGPEDHQYMLEYYQIRDMLTVQYAEEHHADHIVALGNLNYPSGVCGLNVGCNLRVILAEQNLSKGSKSFIAKAEQWNEFGYSPVNPKLSSDSPKWD